MSFCGAALGRTVERCFVPTPPHPSMFSVYVVGPFVFYAASNDSCNVEPLSFPTVRFVQFMPVAGDGGGWWRFLNMV